MKGVIALATKGLIVEKFGEDIWNKILKNAGIDNEPMILPISNIDDSIISKILKSIGEVLNLTWEQIAETFGDYWVNVYTQKNYSVFYTREKTAKGFLLKLDDIHIAMTRNMKDAKPPRFQYKQPDENTLIMKYISDRGLIDIAIGAIKGVGKYYKEDIDVIKIDEETIKIIFKK